MQSAWTFHYQTDQRLAKEAEVAGDMDESLMLREEVKDSDVHKCDQVTRSVSEIFRICLLMRLVYKVLASPQKTQKISGSCSV